MKGDPGQPPRRRLRRPEIDIRRARFALPSGFTLANLFFGIFAIISASRGHIDRAVLCVVLGGVCDAFDGRVARATKSGSEFGEQLDSLVDAISFGLAPALITYFNVMNSQQGWGWVLVWIYCACAVMRLARFNITQAGAAKSYFIGLPSPAAGGTLATFNWFRETELYRQSTIGTLPWDEWVRWLMILLAFLMISNVRYPAVPRIGLRSFRQIGGTVVVLATIIGTLFYSHEYLFPFGLAYVAYGLVSTAFVGFLDMRPNSAAARERALREAYDRPEYAIAGEELMADDVDEDVEFGPRARREGRARLAAADEGALRDRDARRRERKERERERAGRPERAARPEREERPARDRAERAERPARADVPRREPKEAKEPSAEADAADTAARDRRAERRERQREKQRERAARRAAEGTQVSIVPGGEAVAPAPTPAPTAPPPVALDMDADDLMDAADGGDGADETGAEGGLLLTAEGAERKRRKRRRKRRERGLPDGAPPDAAATFSPDDPVIPPHVTHDAEAVQRMEPRVEPRPGPRPEAHVAARPEPVVAPPADPRPEPRPEPRAETVATLVPAPRPETRPERRPEPSEPTTERPRPEAAEGREPRAPSRPQEPNE